ncbi:DJ-1/PfpI family protein [Caldalkalibacillus mannanilyticus]|uniref:DJ-1/PfpI family protein n=1 Tax=Caldalkalibacillus mannanilyticus TaxID=1418 RepID=UPI00046A1716|nr:DJ-1/PfpI family protein [Caldalkalibacillus mannanilyticus]
MKKRALFILPPDRFNEEELFKPQKELENTGVEVTVASTKTGEIIGDYKGKVQAEVVFSEVAATNYDLVVVIGGSGTIDHLWRNEDISNYLVQAHEQKILIAGICAGAVSIVKTGLLVGRKATCYPVDVMINELKAHNVEYLVQNVVAYEDIITSDGPDGATAFGQSLAKALS